MNPEELELAKWLAQEDPDNQDESLSIRYNLKNIQDALDEFQTAKLPSLDFERNWEELAAKKEERKIKTLRRSAWITTIAAGLMVMIGIFFLAMPQKTETLAVEVGTMQLLPDGSSYAYFGTDSKITYQKKKPRSIHLDGQGYFHVSTGDQFEVRSRQGKVVVLGTSFEVTDQATYSVNCFSGKVMVIIEGDKKFTLSPGQGISQTKSGGWENTTFDRTIPAWLDATLRRSPLDFENLLKLIELEYQITIENPSKIDRKFRGQMPFNDLSLSFETLEDALGLNITKVGVNHYMIEEK